MAAQLQNISSVELLEELRKRYESLSMNAEGAKPITVKRKPKRVIFLGAPGSGKGTQADMLKTQFRMYHISTGDILREMAKADTELGRKVRTTMERGELVSDDLMAQLVNTKISSPECTQGGGYILDGFPRSIAQAETLERHLALEGTAIDAVIFFDVRHEELLRRITGRRVHPGSGRSYHIEFNPPKVADIDDVTGEPLIHRKDDTAETLKTRLDAFDSYTAPLIDFYTRRGVLRRLDASQPPKAVEKQFRVFFESMEIESFAAAVSQGASPLKGHWPRQRSRDRDSSPSTQSSSP
eukprot:Selendium_serpulae@DN4581_c0_g1_i1.p1